ncbi:MAG: tetratricopeptide repeat protein [Bryobacteraceae bacterium]
MSLSLASILLGAVVGHTQSLPSGPVTTGSTERAVYFTGKVTLEDGSAPASAVNIQKVCGGQATFVALTDATGHFNFKVGNGGQGTGTADAGEGSGQAPDLMRPWGSASQYSMPITSGLRNCMLEAVLPGFQSEKVNLALKSTMDDTRIGTIILHSLSRAGALTVSATTLKAPPNAKKAFEKGLADVKAQKWDAALHEFGTAVKIYPQFAVAWYEIGVVRQNENDPAGAHDAWKAAFEQDPMYLKPLEGLTALADRQENWVEAEKYSRAWIQLDPDDFPGAFLFNAIACARLNKMEEAERSARAGLAIDKEHRVPRLSYVLGLILLQKPALDESAQYFRAYLEMAPNAKDAGAVRQQLAKLDQAGSMVPRP